MATTPIGRVQFQDLFEARDFDGDGRFRYSVVLAWPKDQEKELKPVRDAVNAAANKKWPDGLPKSFKDPIRDGDEQDNSSLAGLNYVRFASQHAPKVVGPTKGADGKFTELEKGKVYSGCYGRVSFDTYPYDNKSKGVSLGLLNFQFIRDGEALGTTSDPNEDFTEVEPDEVPEDEAADLPGCV